MIYPWTFRVDISHGVNISAHRIDIYTDRNKKVKLVPKNVNARNR